MKARRILKKLGIDPDKPVFLMTAEEAFENILNVMEEYCPNVDLTKISKEDVLRLLSYYGECVVLYHPENDHQERAVILRNAKMLKKYGLTDDDIEILDFS